MPVLPAQSIKKQTDHTHEEAFREGIVDTIRLYLRHDDDELPQMCRRFRVVKKDRTRLRTLGFTSGRERYTKQGDRLIVWRRKRDGARVVQYGKRLYVEFSVPRVLSLENHQVHEVTEDKFHRAIRMMTRDLLPWTTLRAELSSVYDHDLPMCKANSTGWVVSRIDHARDFKEDWTLVRRHSHDVNWGHGGRFPIRPDYAPTNCLLWPSGSRELSIYNKRREIKDRTGESIDLERSIRVEYRAKPRGIFAYAKRLHLQKRRGIRTLPFEWETRDGRVFQTNIPCSYASLHLALQEQLMKFDGADVELPEEPRTSTFRLAQTLAADPSAWRTYCKTQKRAKVRLLQPKVAAYRCQQNRFSLLSRCYPGSNG